MQWNSERAKARKLKLRHSGTWALHGLLDPHVGKQPSREDHLISHYQHEVKYYNTRSEITTLQR